MARRYKVTFENVAVTAAQDLIAITGATGKMLRVLRLGVWCVDTTPPTNQQLSLRVRFLPATVTAGTGGTAPTPQKTDPGDAAASFTARVNDMTTKATTGGTASIIEERGANIFAGDECSFTTPPVIGPSEALVYELLSTVSGTVHLSGVAEVEEIGG